MVIVFKPGAPEDNKAKMRSNLESKGFQINEINGVNMTIFGIIGDTSTLDINMLRIDDAVDKVMRVQERNWRLPWVFRWQWLVLVQPWLWP